MSVDLSLDIRTGLPDALRVLVRELPRTGWQGHPQFNGLVQFWLERHMMFRQLVDVLGDDVRARMDGAMAVDQQAARLSHYGGMLLNQLHGHHQIEDMQYFPRLARLDLRVSAGFDLLEADHGAMDGMLNDLAGAANALLQGGEPGVFLDALSGFGALLERHLTDEEEIVVPVILNSGFDG